MTYFNNRLQPYYFVIAWIGFTAILQWLGKGYFRYDSDITSSLELWRLLTGHWVHLNWTHWLLNSLGFVLLVALLRVRWRLSYWIKVIIIHSLLISIAMLLLNPQLNWYVGFSGALYGLFMLAAIINIKKDKLMSVLIIAIISLKIGTEQFYGSTVSTEKLLGAPVIIDAHAYGFLVGTLLGVFTLLGLIRIK